MPDALIAKSEADLRALAGQCACRVVRSSRLEADGRTYPVLTIECASNEQAVRFLDGAAGLDACDHDVRHLALTLRRAHAASVREHAIGIQEFVKASVPFVRERQETFQHTLYTLHMRAGDCDDAARCVAALALASGLSARVVGLRNKSGAISHVTAQILDDGQWRWAETTVDAFYGEHPRDAAKRLGVGSVRKDVAG